LPVVDLLDICLVAAVQDEAYHVDLAKPCSIVEGGGGRFGIREKGHVFEPDGGYRAAAKFEQAAYYMPVAVASSDM
jgi:hypothetical protein